MALEEKFWLLTGKAISGDISVEEQEELEKIFLIRPDLERDYQNLKKLKLKKTGLSSSEERKALEAGLEKFDQLINNHLFPYTINNLSQQHKPFLKINYYRLVVAATIISLVIGLAVLYNYSSFKPVVRQKEMATQFGRRIHQTLPDGSVIWLNSGSSVKYAENFVGNGKREVILSGEAFFDVKHDKLHPFIVHAGKLSIVVLGTAFNVKAYATDSYTETTLLRGKVEILMSSRPGLNITLLPNQKVTVITANSEIKKTVLPAIKQPLKDSVESGVKQPLAEADIPDEHLDETAWVEDRLIFKHETFADLALRLERWYNIKIIFDDQKYQQKQFTGKFKDQDISEVMRALQFTQPFKYNIANNQVHIW